jgi:DNA-binding CsgD family transcriptional regulator
MAKWQHARGPELLWPLQIPARTVGVLQFNFLAVPDASEVIEDISAISPVFSLLALHASPPDRDFAHTPGSDAGPGIEVLPRPLSDRQLDILKWMSMGMTNDQIAHQIKFSASTVRQETMAIYRYLHVGGRSEAAAEGKRLALI